ncbi:MAG TPA: ATP-binding protein [Candidatus Hydrogenedentes bacterium]|nr:ATP-binding protein [Candidatus Hydrogenedentota bacterium]HOV74034.1 ATP-binding protein [Candidatus Hydrogenedentota bacterium]HPC15980.1 ATP-binding protein [Candidatus Hydrogenedentota bacterium]HRT19934.1 ATP-binding protein [Candidatus Hydrogenedentota bacterium]HRT64612.1 ATP-binding protein [Candidatus Hydrogenedentota bacterium]
MRIAIASGKGGTGKTTIAVNLAGVTEGPVTYVDCDVEEPNGHIFLKPNIETVKSVGIPVPVVDKEKCTGCGRCAEVCRYNAIACVKGKVLVFAELCHGCGGCRMACAARAISETDHAIGVVETGYANGVAFVQGRLKVGAAMSPPLIRATKAAAPANGIVIIDAPPGTSCPVIAAIKDTDVVVLVTEPTPFGLHDLRLAVETVRQVGIPFGVVVNRCDVGDERVTSYCKQECIPVLLEIPDDRRIAEAYSRGENAIDAVPEMRELFTGLCQHIRELIAKNGMKEASVL